MPREEVIEAEIYYDDPSALRPGTLLCGGRYRIVRFLSSGGFGKTYEAEHILLHKRMAIKEFFPKDFCNRDKATSYVTVGTESKRKLIDKLHRKFVGEAQAVAQLNHPGIVQVSDVFEENWTAYYVMDYIEGGSLRDKVKSVGRLNEADAIHYIRQVCDALAYVHSLNRLHLDIKPGNIMVGSDGHAILIDFGSSKQYDEVSGENTSTLLGSTAGYAPPEQTSQAIHTFYPATDIYAVGATLYNMLTGETPKAANDRISGDELEPLPPGVSAGTRTAIEAAMRLNKQKRPQSVGAFLELLGGNRESKSKKMSKPTSEPVDVTEISGSIRVLCAPAGSNIKIDGKSVGTTPRKIGGIDLGQHHVEVSKAGYESKSWTVNVGTGSITEVKGTLTALAAPPAPSSTGLPFSRTKRSILIGVLVAMMVGAIVFMVSVVSRSSSDSAIADIKESIPAATGNRASAATSGTINGHEWVNLGLSVKWATCNVGASGPSNYGKYYAWGETSTKSTYTDDNSKTYGKSMDDIAGDSRFDAALANWGGTWRLPTKAEMEELVDKCTWTWKGNGYNVTGPNGNSIFLPATGVRGKSSLSDAGSVGYYWSSIPCESNNLYTNCLEFSSGSHDVYLTLRFWGHSIRPVAE